MHRISVPLNAQQLELLDRTILGGAAPDRAALLKRALREFAVRRKAPPVTPVMPPKDGQ